MNIKKIIDKVQQSEGNYYSSRDISNRLSVSTAVLGQITSGLLIQSRSLSESISVGLFFKSTARNEKLHGYSRNGANGWEYSEKAVAAIEEYVTLFPEFIAGLEKQKGNVRFSPKEAFVPGTCDQEAVKMLKWLLQQDWFTQPHASTNSELLSQTAIAELEGEMERVQSARKDSAVCTTILHSVTPQELLRPSLNASADLEGQTFKIGHRVVYALEHSGPPFGTVGVVVGGDGACLDVLFDQTFAGSSSLGGRCSLYRGLRVHRSALLNLTMTQLGAKKLGLEEAKAQLSPPLSPTPASPPAHTGASAPWRRKTSSAAQSQSSWSNSMHSPRSSVNHSESSHPAFSWRTSSSNRNNSATAEASGLTSPPLSNATWNRRDKFTKFGGNAWDNSADGTTPRTTSWSEHRARSAASSSTQEGWRQRKGDIFSK
ncbi:hypothetical protein THASP1DRAFT_33694 [Thamnocephalis sphaerospora]|uniref:Uncharacterized protein n=1 Tax=Thamnocephalis sphaerospora TaxID=78915 RepID=A0A4P9XGZ9_9FUNG|nr:hypothetical protein THASP1DRAFT_33694 [Thamnocephalis sphaerospora]|eukprot:RKP04531.1 hypothetical protein THASP1DRAFT_33694 [Thamnocephalis sphaerospora]